MALSCLVCCLLGAACPAIQVLVPLAASVGPAKHGGRVIGRVMSGVLVGILVSRPLASIVAGASGSPACLPALGGRSMALYEAFTFVSN
jgi:hypothetical protein